MLSHASMFMESQKIAQIASLENVKKASVSGRLLEEGWFDAANVEIQGTEPVP